MIFLGANIGDCPHTEGLYKASRVAKMAGFKTFVCHANSSNEQILGEINRVTPDYIGFSYRLSPQNGFNELKKIIRQMEFQGLIFKPDGNPRKIAFAGLPETIAVVKARKHEFPVDICPISQVRDPLQQIDIVFDYFDLSLSLREKIICELRKELFPPGIELLNQLADYVMEDEGYHLIPPLPIPGEKARRDMMIRMDESPYPLLRSHFGIPDDNIKPTVEGINALASARVIDEVSIGSSDLSQRYYGKPEEFVGRKNDGGVPYKDINDLRELYLASRTGNFPSCKPYAHTTGIIEFIDDCISAGMLIGAHQAIPLFWFNQLDGRGSTPVMESIKEHVEAVKKLALLGIPVEMNDPNQWSSRWAHDTVVVADYGIISSVMLENGVRNIILQMQFNKPHETGDFGDLAKMKTSMAIAEKMKQSGNFLAKFYNETRTGIEYFSTDLDHAKWQLARSTLLQLFLNPAIIHLVSYCEANRVAKVDDIIESSRIIRRTIDVFRDNEPDLRKYEEDPMVKERVEFLEKESSFLIDAIARLDCNFDKTQSVTKFLSNPETIFKSIDKRYMTAPGIMNPDFKNDRLVTKPINGVFNAVDFDNGKILSEKQRLNLLL